MKELRHGAGVYGITHVHCALKGCEVHVQCVEISFIFQSVALSSEFGQIK